MLDQVLRLFGIVPDYDLNIMKRGQDLYDITTAVLAGMRGVLAEAKPDVVLVHGDTTTSAAAALAAFTRGFRWGMSKRACVRTICTTHGPGRSTVS